MVRLIAGHVRLILILASVTSLLALTLLLVEIPHNPLAIVGRNLRAARSSRQGNMVVRPAQSGHKGILQLSGERPEALADERDWLAMCQLPNGALAQTPYSDRVVPYFANIAAKSLIDVDPGAAAKYMVWYLSQLNRPDRWGLSGTIYDYEVERHGFAAGSEATEIVMIATRNYDSADSYAATFLTLVSEYYYKTQDSELVTANLDDINLVAQVIVSLQDKDGLVFVKPGSRTKYLMDNAENYRGLIDWSNILEKLGNSSLAAYYRNVAQRIRNGIAQTLYDSERETFAWSLSPFGKRFPKKGKWYPDGVSQLYLVTCGVLPPEDPKAIKVWEEFNSQFPGWEFGEKRDRFPWSSVAIASIIMGDRGKAVQFAQWAEETFLLNNRPYPWYVLESSNVITLTELLAKTGTVLGTSLAER